jgi:pyruvate formate lyase activating enzyme
LTQLPATPLATLTNAREIAQDAGLKFVYSGNVPGSDSENTFCPGCKKAIILRRGYTILENHLNKGNCKFCGEKIPGVWF